MHDALMQGNQKAHPRLRGDHCVHHPHRHIVSGSSPPARGPRGFPSLGARRGGLIPACAGTTLFQAWMFLLRSAHPRLRGDHSTPTWPVETSPGSSPPARGPPLYRPDPMSVGGLIPACAGTTKLEHAHQVGRGLIPACAGTTKLEHAHQVGRGAHPRLRGDHCMGAARVGGFEGSSPPARGPHAGRGPADRGPGLIPACAGTTPS